MGFPGGTSFLATFQGFYFSPNKCLFPRDSLGFAKGAIRESCQENIQWHLGFQCRPGLIQEVGFCHTQQDKAARAWEKEESQSMVSSLPGAEEEEPVPPQWQDKAFSTAEASRG